MEAEQGSSRTPDERVAFGRLLWAGPVSGVSAAAANAVVYAVASLSEITPIASYRVRRPLLSEPLSSAPSYPRWRAPCCSRSSSG